MKKSCQRVISILSVCFSMLAVQAHAGSIIEVQNDNELTTILSDGGQARINLSASQYALVDYQSGTVKMVDPDKQQVVLFNGKADSHKSAPSLRFALQKAGGGMPVAGYATQKYTLIANGRNCGLVYGSREAYKLQGMKELFAALDKLVKQQQAAMGGYVAMIDPCTRAKMRMQEKIKEIGIPMRMEMNGKLDSQVTSIKLNVSLPSDTFVIPASYKTVSMKEQMRQAQQRVDQQAKQYQPQMRQMMQQIQQMQQSGQLREEDMTQMQMMQQMMQQQQR